MALQVKQQLPVLDQQQPAQAACRAKQRAQHGLLAAPTAGALTASSTFHSGNGFTHNGSINNSRSRQAQPHTVLTAVQRGELLLCSSSKLCCTSLAHACCIAPNEARQLHRFSLHQLTALRSLCCWVPCRFRLSPDGRLVPCRVSGRGSFSAAGSAAFMSRVARPHQTVRSGQAVLCKWHPVQ